MGLIKAVMNVLFLSNNKKDHLNAHRSIYNKIYLTQYKWHC